MRKKVLRPSQKNVRQTGLAPNRDQGLQPARRAEVPQIQALREQPSPEFKAGDLGASVSWPMK